MQALDADIGVQRAAGKPVEHEPLRKIRRHGCVCQFILVIRFIQQPEHNTAADGNTVLARFGLLRIGGRLRADQTADIGREIGKRIFKRNLFLACCMADPPREVNSPCGGFHIGSTTLLLFLLHLYAAKGHAMRFFTDMPPAAENRARSSADGSNVRR